ncbi:MAG: hypothetical protein IJ874_10005 [Ruminococcus sp.]|nr:hypothetical protein [Ruminococcus sp.]
MLRKLVKHEYIYLIKTFTPIYIIYLASAAALRLFTLFGYDFIDSAAKAANPVIYSMTIIYFFVVAAFTILASVMAILTMADNVRRFKNNMFTDEGYLTNTLPVTATEHIAAKLIAGCTNFLCSFAVLTLGLFIASRSSTSFILKAIWEAITDPDVEISEKLTIILLIFMVYITFQLLGYLAVSLSSMANGGRGFLGGIVGAFSTVFGLIFISRVAAFSVAGGLGAVPSMLMVCLVLLVFCVIMGLIVTMIIKNHLNLQ